MAEHVRQEIIRALHVDVETRMAIAATRKVKAGAEIMNDAMAQYFACLRPPNQDAWCRVYHSSYNLCMAGHVHKVEAIIDKYGALSAAKFRNARTREAQFKVYCGLLVRVDNYMKCRKRPSVAARLKAATELEARNRQTRRRLQMYIKLVGCMTCLARRAADRCFKPGGVGAISAQNEFYFLAEASEASEDSFEPARKRVRRVVSSACRVGGRSHL
jgi:hypothetical protein